MRNVRERENSTSSKVDDEVFLYLVEGNVTDFSRETIVKLGFQ
jgi:hypothetical protein